MKKWTPKSRKANEIQPFHKIRDDKPSRCNIANVTTQLLYEQLLTNAAYFVCQITSFPLFADSEF